MHITPYFTPNTVEPVITNNSVLGDRNIMSTRTVLEPHMHAGKSIVFNNAAFNGNVSSGNAVLRAPSNTGNRCVLDGCATLRRRNRDIAILAKIRVGNANFVPS